MRIFKENAMMQEMNLQEMKEVNGGLFGAVVGLILMDILLNPDSACEAFMAGWNSWDK